MAAGHRSGGRNRGVTGYDSSWHPVRRTSKESAMTDRLDEPLVTSSLKVLPHWTGDSTRISRSVLIAGTEAEQFLRALAESADAMNHHPEVEQGDGRLRISLSTHSAGGVTALDIAMASH